MKNPISPVVPQGPARSAILFPLFSLVLAVSPPARAQFTQQGTN